MCARALAADRQNLVDEVLLLMRQHYEQHCFDLTRLYPGIPELVTELGTRGLTLAVLSNKPDHFTKRMIAHYFEPSSFVVVRGQMPNVPLKPDPTAALQIAQEVGVPPAHWLYLGDTDTDMRTARAAGMEAVGVLWGFRDRQELLENGAKHIVAKPADVGQCL